jgi:ribosomal small subunit protein bTHX
MRRRTASAVRHRPSGIGRPAALPLLRLSVRKVPEVKQMGKGDRRSRRGKLFRGSHGKKLPHRLGKAKAGSKADAKPRTPAS